MSRTNHPRRGVKIVTLDDDGQSWRIQPVPGDGHCFFHAVAAGMDGDWDHRAMRELVGIFLQSHGNEIGPMDMYNRTWATEVQDDSKKSFEKYVKDISKTNAWGGQIEAWVISAALQCNVLIYGPHKKDKGKAICNQEIRGSGQHNSPLLLS